MEQTRLITLGRGSEEFGNLILFRGNGGGEKLVVANRVCKGGP